MEVCLLLPTCVVEVNMEKHGMKPGNLKKKQTVFDDCIAAAEYLISEKYTNPKLALEGGDPTEVCCLGVALTNALIFLKLLIRVLV